MTCCDLTENFDADFWFARDAMLCLPLPVARLRAKIKSWYIDGVVIWQKILMQTSDLREPLCLPFPHARLRVKIHRSFLLQHCASQPRQHCYPETKCHRTPETKCVPVQKDKCTKVPVDYTAYVEEKQCLPFELDLAHLTAQHGDPCASFHVGHLSQVLIFNIRYM